MTEMEYLAGLMEKNGVSNRELADRLGVTLSTVWDRINNRSRKSMSVPVFAAMLDALGYDLVAVPRGAADGLPDAWKAPTGAGE